MDHLPAVVEIPQPERTPRLSLWDAISILVGIIVGVGIFQNPHNVAENVPSAAAALLVWTVGGLVVIGGALCFAELAATYPRSGGEFVYLTRAFGPLVGFLCCWTQLAVLRTCSIGWLAYMFGIYAGQFLHVAPFVLALASLWGLTLINILGVTLGKNTQNVLTVCKILGLAVIVVIGIGWGSFERYAEPAPRDAKEGWFFLAMVPVFWSYAGWNEAAYIVSEVKNPTKNLPRALILGTLIVMAIYLTVNFAYLLGVGLKDLAGDKDFASTLVSRAWPGNGPLVISLFISISALGANNGMIFTTARLCSEFGTDHALFRRLSQWHPRVGTPVLALVFQATLVTCVMIGVEVEFVSERASKDKLEYLIDITIAVFFSFLLLTGLALIVLRQREPGRLRPFQAPAYPVLPILFCAWCGYMVWGAVRNVELESLVGLGILLLGIPLYAWSRYIEHRGLAAAPSRRDASE